MAYIALKFSDGAAVIRLTGLASSPASTDVTNGVPPVNVLRYIENRIVAGTDRGVYALTGTNDWVLIGQDLPNVPVEDVLETRDGTLIALTHGRGVWVLKGAKEAMP